MAGDRSADLDWWEASTGGGRCASGCARRTASIPTTSSWTRERARARGLTSTVTFPRGNLAPEGSVIKSTAIDPSVVDADGVYRKTGPARVFTRERDADRGDQEPRRRRLKPGDVLVLICRGPLGAGMEEIYQITAALKHLSFGKHVAVLTDARFSGVSTGACIGHVGPEALAGGPIGKVRDGDLHPDRHRSQPARGQRRPRRRRRAASSAPRKARACSPARPPRPDLAPDPDLPADTRLWAALQQVGGGTWGGCVYDVDAIAQGASVVRAPATALTATATATSVDGDGSERALTPRSSVRTA